MSTVETATRPYATARPAHDSEQSLHMKDIMGLVLATLMTLGPLAATAMFSH
jgi:hypothetical protein